MQLWMQVEVHHIHPHEPVLIVIYLKIKPDDMKNQLKDIKERGVVLRPKESIDEMYKTRY